MGLEEVVETINRYSSFLIASHINPDGDGIGSQFALASLLEKMGKRAIVVGDDPVPEGYRFLSKKWLLTKQLDKSLNFEVVVVIECGSLDRIGALSGIIPKDAVIVNIDHHPDNEGFGKVNWVDATAGAVSEMIYELYQKFNISLGKDEALFLYVAIVTDTGSFRYGNTTSASHKVASELLGLGVEPAKVAEKLYEENSLSITNLLARALSTIQLTTDGKIASLYVTRDMLAETKAEPDQIEGFVNYARAIKGVKVAFFLKEIPQEDEIKVSLRSKIPVDISVVARSFGGGGHPQAAGCTIKGEIKDVIPQVIKKVKKLLK